MAPESPLSQGVPANTLLIRHLKSRCKAAYFRSICEETTREDMIWTIYEMVRRTPKRKAVRSNRAWDARRLSRKILNLPRFLYQKHGDPCT